MFENPMYQLYQFQKKVMNDRDRYGVTNEEVITEMYSAIVKSVNSDTFTVDVFIINLNAEMKNVQVLMPAISQKGGRIILPQVNSVVVVAMVSYMKPFVIATMPILDSDIPLIHKNEIIDYTNNTFSKHTVNGDIFNMSGSLSSKIIKENGVSSEYNLTDSRYSRYGYKISGTNNNVGSIDYEKVYLKNNEDDNSTTLEKLYNLKDKLSNHMNSISNLKSELLKSGIDKDAILNSVSQLRSLLYNEYINSDNFIITQKGLVLNKDIKSFKDIENISESDIKHSEDGSKLLYETVCKFKDNELKVSIDENNNIDIKCNKLKINGKEVQLIE